MSCWENKGYVMSVRETVVFMFLFVLFMLAAAVLAFVVPAESFVAGRECICSCIRYIAP